MKNLRYFFLAFALILAVSHSPNSFALSELNDNREFIEKIRNDIGLSVNVRMILDPGERFARLTRRIDYVIRINGDFYKTLNADEKRALIGHEMGHIAIVSRYRFNGLQVTALQVSADFFAVKYAGVDAVLSLLDKLYFDKSRSDYKIRKAALKAVKMDYLDES